ncbi:replication initiation protein [Neiella marina]|uniref:Replication initiation protein n=1 Tax=Neiella holothuriorum TaxID=2870530 RepID=A0ABS7EGB1_9GAMM|nr:replication initiation protein [Neiella holothuriorum]MBW8191338.1 replication initiation protein [Neiella holothuriorum]
MVDSLSGSGEVVVRDIQRLSANFKKSHGLLMAFQSLTPMEHNALALFLTRIKKDMVELPPVDMSVPYEKRDANLEVPTFTFDQNVLCEWFDIAPDQLATRLNEVAEKLMFRKMAFRDMAKKGGVESFDYKQIFQRIVYHRGRLTFVPAPVSWRDLVDESRGFALIDHAAFRKIPSEYGKRTYALLSRFKRSEDNLGAHKIDELQKLYGVVDNAGKPLKSSLVRPSMFVERVIKKSIAEIEEIKASGVSMAGLSFHIDDKSGEVGYRVTRRGKRIDTIEFLYSWDGQALKEIQAIIEVNRGNAIEFVERLEAKRFQNTKLSVVEQIQLSLAYRELGQFDDAKVEQQPIDAHLKKLERLDRNELLTVNKFYLAIKEGDKAYAVKREMDKRERRNGDDLIVDQTTEEERARLERVRKLKKEVSS